MIDNLMYIELKTGYSDDAPAWIGYVKTSKSKKILTFPQMRANIIPSLTVRKIKNGYKPSKHGLCSRFSFRNDMCYIMILLI